MSLQLILGNSGSGKSHLLYEKIIEESRKHPEHNYMVIVPEQFTMQTQKDLVMQHPDRGIMNIDVLSFRRLAHRIFEETGSDRRMVLTETGKNLMLRKVAIEQQEKLKILGTRMSRPGYVSEVKSMLSELMQYEITDADLEEMMDYARKRPLLYAKLEDIRVLYRAFLDYQRERFMKPEELMDVLCQVADRSEILKNSTLAFDGFTGFTPSQRNVLKRLFAVCPRIWITVTIDVRENIFGGIQEHELFALSKKMIRSVTEIANAAKKTIEPPILSGREALPRFIPGGALQHLEQNIFRSKRNQYLQPTEEISLHAADTLADEVHYAARRISRLVMEQGCRYKDIAIITGNMAAYGNYIKKIFSLYKIPVFLDETRHILLNPCLEFVRGALAVAEKDFPQEAVFSFLRTGMAGLAPEEIDRLENYVLAAGIRGRKKWSDTWNYCPERMTSEELALCSSYRERAMKYLLPFAEKMRQKENTLLDCAKALYELLENCQVQQKLKDRELQLASSGSRDEAREYSQVYSVLITLLEEMADLMGSEKVTGQEFREILEAGFSEAKIGIIPAGIDMVQVGDITRSRLAHVKVLLFLGLNDGWVPAAEKGGGIVSDMEREALRERGIELAPSSRENSYIQRFYLYQNLTKPSRQLYLSWCASNGEGTAMRPSYLVSVIRRLFPGIPVIKEKPAGTSVYQVTSRENGLICFTGGLQQVREGRPDASWMELYSIYLKDEQYGERVRELVQAAFAGEHQGRLSWQTSRELYGETMTNSVTRLEQFAACAFAHFAVYGLRLSQREMYGVNPADLGVIFHRAMELFSGKLRQEKISWTDVTLEEQEKWMDQCVDEVTKEYRAGALRDSAREAYTVKRVKRILCRAVWAMQEQIRAGDFRPAGFEVSFADAGDLESIHVRFGDSGKLRLQGRIDRIDTAETDDCVYVKIVDYKSGVAKFEPLSLYYGLQLQLVVYLNAALEIERKFRKDKKVAPAGIFYYHLEDPVLERETDVSDDQMREKLLKKLRPEGLLNGEAEVLRLLDRDMSGDSLVIPAGLKKDGSLKAASSAVSQEQFEQMSVFVSHKMEDMAEEMLQGEIAARPFSDGTRSACDYCSFSDVCGFDRKIPGMFAKRAPELGKNEVWERIAQECGEIAKMQEKQRNG